MRKFSARSVLLILLLTIGIGAGMAGMETLRSMSSAKKAIMSATPVSIATPVVLKKVDLWPKIAPRLRDAQIKDEKVVEPHIQRIHDFFSERKRNLNVFAEDLLGWNSKWALLNDKIFGDSKNRHRELMQKAFEEHLFTEAELKEVVQNAVVGYLSELEANEGAMLLAVRADLSEEDLPALRAMPAFRSDQAFQGEFRKMLGTVVPIAHRDFDVTVVRETAVLVASEVAAAITVRIASAVAVRLGVSTGILGAAASSSVVTFGIGLGIGFAVDGIADWAMRKAGYDPTKEIVTQTETTIDRIHGLLVDGDPTSHRDYQDYRRMQATHADPSVREYSKTLADRLVNDGSLGIRFALQNLGKARNALREQALKKLVIVDSSR